MKHICILIFCFLCVQGISQGSILDTIKLFPAYVEQHKSFIQTNSIGGKMISDSIAIIQNYPSHLVIKSNVIIFNDVFYYIDHKNNYSKYSNTYYIKYGLCKYIKISKSHKHPLGPYKYIFIRYVGMNGEYVTRSWGVTEKDFNELVSCAESDLEYAKKRRLNPYKPNEY